MGEPGVRQATVGAPCGRPTGIPTSPGSSAQRKLVWASRSWPCVIARARCRGGLRPPLGPEAIGSQASRSTRPDCFAPFGCSQ
jgi:hypothetical protein